MSNCTTCGTCKEDCQCIPTGLTTPPSCPPDLPPCPQPNPCNETFDSKCVIYTGEDIPCFSIETGNSVEEVITNMTSLLQPLLCLNCTIINFPANDATQVPVNQILSWNVVPGATSYDVYFGTTPLTPPLVSIGQISTAYTPPAPLVPNTDYYWKIVPKNSAGSAQNCPTYHFKTTELLCINPLSYMLEYVMSEQPPFLGPQIPPVDVPVLIASINDFLDNGELITNCNFCCPDCTETDRYMLASAPLFALYYSEFYNLPNCPPPCCIEVDASLTALSTQFNQQTPALVTAFATVPPVTNCCATNFSECAAALKVSLGTERDAIFKLLGVVEESTINGSTELCILATFLSGLPIAVTDVEKASIIAAILNKGFVVQCRPEGTIISGYLAYKNYINNVQSGCLCYVPCQQP
jgi:hypothetical protein